MRRLLVGALERLGGRGGEPVIQLKTAFGGGKTHTMLALYHLLRDPERAGTTAPVADLVRDAGGVPSVPKVAVLVGTALDPQRHTREAPEGAYIATLWGEMAYQLAGFKGYELVQQADYSGTAPGSNTLVELFEMAGSSAILIDELVAYIRNIQGARGKLLSGSFNSNLTFVQNLTEAVKRSPHALLVASIPESRIELGDASGEEVARRIENTFGRLEAVWQPVAAHESFEVVRRRLFGGVSDRKAMERTVSAFGELYRTNGSDFPVECREVAYEGEIAASYPIHPEVFQRLYEDWSTMERFQRTRGVLRLLATAISVLWERNDRSPLITPGSLPLDHPRVRHEMTRYLGDSWNAVVDGDIDGENASSVAIDREVPRMGQVQACRRVARTVFLGSVPSKATRGVEDNRIKLGCVQPGEQIAVYSDAFSRMRDTLTYLYSSEGGRYWFAVQPNLNRTVADRASKVEASAIRHELEDRMRRWKTKEGVEFAGVHLAPERAEDVPDEDRARLVVLPPSFGHKRGEEKSAALERAMETLDTRGAGPRRFRNMLVFLAADGDALDTLTGETRRYLAWKSTLEDRLALNLEAQQVKQCEAQVASLDRTVNIQLDNAYAYLLVPRQEGTSPVEMDVVKLSAGGDFGAVGTVLQRASYRAVADEHLITRWSPALLGMELGRYNLWPKDAEHVGIRQLWGYFATFAYLPRLRDRQVLLDTIKSGASATDFFGYATSADDAGGYQGLYFGRQPSTVYDDEAGVLVKPEAARGAQSPPQPTPSGGTTTATVNETGAQWGAAGGGVATVSPAGIGPVPASPPPASLPTRFFGSVELDPEKLGSAAGQVGAEVVQHLVSLFGAEVKVRLEIEVTAPDGVPGDTMRTVTENANTLKFRTADFGD